MGGHFNLPPARRDDPAVGNNSPPLAVDFRLFKRGGRRDDPNVIIAFLAAAAQEKADDERGSNADGYPRSHFHPLPGYFNLSSGITGRRR
jgi:hypothetical protein